MTFKNLDIEEFPLVNVPSDVKEDIKLWKVVPVKTLIICTGALFASLILGIFLKVRTDIGWATFLFVLFGPFTGAIIIFGYNLPGRISKEISYRTTVSTVKTLADLSDIKEIDGSYITYKDGSVAVIIEFISEIPWDTATFEAKYERGVMYVYMISRVVRPNIEIDLYSVTAKEEAPFFLQRMRTLSRCKTKKIRMKAEARIRHHATIENKAARKTSYCIRLRVYDLFKGQKEKLLDQAKKAINLLDKNGSRATYLGGDALNDYIESQLIPMAPIVRGKAEDILVDDNDLPEDGFKQLPLLKIFNRNKLKEDLSADETQITFEEENEEDNETEKVSIASKMIKISTAREKNRSKIKIFHGKNED